MRPGARDSITDVTGVLVGHHHVLDSDAAMGVGAATGCTVVRVPGGAVASVDVRGGGPGTRETDLLNPANTVQRAHAVLLTGGSAHGLAAADGVMDWLERRGEGIAMGFGPDGRALVVPIVPAAVIFDLPVGDWHIRPTADFGHLAAGAAGVEFGRGSVGAGTAAVAGALKGGVGTSSVVLDDGPAAGVTVGAVVVANPLGDVFDPATGLPWAAAGPRYRLRVAKRGQLTAANALERKNPVLNTTIGVVATDAALSKAACRRVAMAAHDGLARAIVPAHSPLDGDSLFALATGTRQGEDPAAAPLAVEFPSELPVLAPVCAAAAVAVARAVVDAVLSATSVAGVPAYREALSSVFV